MKNLLLFPATVLLLCLTTLAVAQIWIAGLRRPGGLAWAKDALWIAEFDGQIWRLPFVQ